MSEETLPAPVVVEDIPVHPITKRQLIETLARWSSEPQRRRIYNVNAHAMNIAQQDPRFRESIQTADLIYCDGVGVLWAARALGHRIPERLTVADWFDEALAQLASTGSSVFFLGDEQHVAEFTAHEARRRHPLLKVAGFNSGYFEIAGEGEEKLISHLHEVAPDVVFVGMGMPRQEFWIDANLERLPVGVYIPVGAAFRWFTSPQTRTPRAMRALGLEWLGRLLMEPRRLWRRYLVGIPAFACRIARAARRTSQ